MGMGVSDDGVVVDSESEGGEAEDRTELDESGQGQNVPVETTPVKKARARPVSEQLLGRGKPRPMYEDDKGEFIRTT